MASVAATVDNKVADSCDRSTALDDLNAAFERSGLADKALAAECGVSKFVFSRMRAGLQAFGVDRLDAIPPAVRVEFYRRQLARVGYDVRAIDPAEVTDEILAAIEQLGRLGKLARLGKARPAKVGE